uniref:Porin n=1 Tax=candidate division WOR-3 bacterium TaxID=2052148 RepID=A0A7C4CBB1_UNCW3
MHRLKVLFAAAATLFVTSVFAQEPGETQFEHNGWFRYTNQSNSFKVTDPSVSRFALERGYVRLAHRWTNQLFTKFTLDFHSSDKYTEGATVRLKEAYADLAIPFLKDFNFTAGLQKHYFGLIYSWDYTHPDKTLADDRGVCASADYGLTVNGFLPGGFGEVQLGVYNGEGYKYAGKFVNVSPELLANLRLTPFAGLQFGASVFTNAKDNSPYKNDATGGRRSSDNKLRLMPDTANTERLAFAPMLRLAFGPVSLTGEYISYSFTRKFSQYKLIYDSANVLIDSTKEEKSRDYAQSGFDLMPLVTLAGRKVEVYGRYSMWERKEQSGDSMPVNLGASFTRFGGGVNYHFVRREKGKPGMGFQLAWIREKSRKEGAEPKDTFMAQFRFEWDALLKPPAL